MWAAKDAKQQKELARQKEQGQEIQQAAAKASKACERQLREAKDTLRNVELQLEAEVASRVRSSIPGNIHGYVEEFEEPQMNAGQSAGGHQCAHGDEECLALSSKVHHNLSNVGCAICNCSDRSRVPDVAHGPILGPTRANTSISSVLFASLETSDSGLLLEALLVVVTTSVSLLRKAVLVATNSKDLGFLDTLPDRAAAEAAAAIIRARRLVCDKASTLLQKGCVQAPKLLQVVVAKTEKGLAAIVQAQPELKVWLPALGGAATSVNGVGPSEEAALRFLARCLALVIWLLAFVYLVLWRGICVVLIWKLLVGSLFLGPVKLFLQLCGRTSLEHGARHTHIPGVAAQSHVYV